MTRKSATAFVLGATAAAVVGATALLAGSVWGDGLATGWAATGFLAMALPGVTCGAWLAREHGRSGPGFVVALVVGIVVRFAFAGSAAFGAAKAGGSAATGLLAGLAAGFVPVMLFETAWFVRSLKVPCVGTEPRG